MKTNKMKTGTITFHAANNCGSMLQSYALQQSLFKLGYENEIIDFSNKEQHHMYALLRKPTNMHDLIYDIATLAYYKKFKCHYDDYKYFLKTYLKLSKEEYHTAKELEKTEDFYDVFITGSDQVWNTCCPDADDAYYLNFVSNKPKIAYAPSFGATNIQQSAQNPEKYKKYLSEIKSISIRENNGAKWIKEMTGRDVPVLLDPTLLLTKNEYCELLDGVEAPKGKFIFYYAFNYSDEVNKTVKKISERLNMPVYILDAKNWVKKAKKYGFKLTKNSGPLTFLKLMFDAELVLTTSFHGTVFSIIGHKKFWFVNSSMHNDLDDRAGTILNMFGLSERMLNGEELLKQDIMKELNYDVTDEVLAKERLKSYNYLQDSLEI